MRKLNVYFDLNLQISLHLCSTNLNQVQIAQIEVTWPNTWQLQGQNGVLELLLAYFNVFITINVLIIHRYSDNLYVLLVHYAL